MQKTISRKKQTGRRAATHITKQRSIKKRPKVYRKVYRDEISREEWIAALGPYSH